MVERDDLALSLTKCLSGFTHFVIYYAILNLRDEISKCVSMTWRAIRVSGGPYLEASRIVGHINKMMSAWHAENNSVDIVPNLGLVLDSLQAGAYTRSR